MGATGKAANAVAKTKITTSFVASTSKRIGYWLEHRPVASNSLLCLSLWIVGDCSAQYSEDRLHNKHSVSSDTTDSRPRGLTEGPPVVPTAAANASITEEPSRFWKDRFDAGRTARCAGFGAVVSGPILALWYPFLDTLCRRYQLAARGGIWAAPVAKVLADEFLMDPPTLVLFFGVMTAAEGGSLDDCRQTIATQFWPSWTTSLAIWPGVLLGTFRFLPVPFQAPVINACCIVWDGFLSHRKALAKQQQQQQQQHDSIAA